MQTILNKFTTEHLFDASAAMLSHLKIKFTPQTKTPITFENLYTGATNSSLTMSLSAVLKKVRESFFIGTIDEDSLAGRDSDFDLQQEVEGKYQTMLVFAVDINAGEDLTRTELATLTRGFNRMASSLPIIVFIKNDNLLSLATCERSQYRQNWRDGEKLGKVAILRNINCIRPHRGHIDILESLGDKAYPTFDELYAHWLKVFSSELLTKKFYTELSEWYAWVIASGKVKFPNDINTTEDDTKYNHESVIRLITRLIFVWFLKQKNLIPKEFFDETFIREKFIANFDPHSTNTLFYNPEQSKYYRLILQNLFFAMLNRPIMDEESGNDENRRFATAHRYQGKSQDYNINNLLRYKSEFAPGGADLLLKIANSTVPFLNGGLFECLDDKDNGKYYDGFSERKASLEQLSFPDYFFFGDEVGSDVDLSDWYDDRHRNHVKVRGLIDILKRYNFTVEENTPLDQEVSLDPELLGKVFENLLASYNPETNTTARKQTGSFYTPREIVQYMVDESLIEHLCRICGVENKERYRSLLSYSTDNTDFTDKETDAIIEALHCCKILDPACGSGAFPMGILQQMVHALRKLDPTNERWKEFILKISLDKDKQAYQVKDETERNRLRVDIEQAFNRSINDPDYARKLYLIENCIYGVDIQPIAVQISKLRFFISLVAEQKPSNITKDNFGIRPLPNLEAKFVAANSLIPLGEGNIFIDNHEKIIEIKRNLAEANHKLFIAKSNKDKRILRDSILEIRHNYSDALLAVGAIDDDNAMKLAKWNMFDQNDFARFFDSQWMFGLSDGFDIVIGNPPYIKEYTNRSAFDGFRETSQYYQGKMDLWYGFACIGIDMLKNGGNLCFIATNNWTTNSGAKKLRNKIIADARIIQLCDFRNYMIFETADIQTMIIQFQKDSVTDHYNFDFKNLLGTTFEDVLKLLDGIHCSTSQFLTPKFSRKGMANNLFTFSANDELLNKIANNKDCIFFSNEEIAQGIVFPQDFLNKKGQAKLGHHSIGDGIFGLTKKELDELMLSEKEYSLIKPYFTSNEVNKYFTKPQSNSLWMIYTDSSFRNPESLKDYPAIKAHLDQFVEIFTSDNKPYGLHRARNNYFFQGEKVIALRKCANGPLFSFSESDCYITQTFNIIKSKRVNLKYLTVLLNSKLIAFWLRNRGKMQGTNYQLDKEPLQQIPVKIPNFNAQNIMSNLFDNIVLALDAKEDICYFQNEIDYIVYHLYRLTYDEVLIIDPETPITRKKYDSYE